MCEERKRLQTLLERLRELDLRLPPPHERPIVEVARAALAAEIDALSRRLPGTEYWRGRRSARRDAG